MKIITVLNMILLTHIKKSSRWNKYLIKQLFFLALQMLYMTTVFTYCCNRLSQNESDLFIHINITLKNISKVLNTTNPGTVSVC